VGVGPRGRAGAEMAWPVDHWAVHTCASRILVVQGFAGSYPPSWRKARRCDRVGKGGRRVRRRRSITIIGARHARLSATPAYRGKGSTGVTRTPSLPRVATAPHRLTLDGAWEGSATAGRGQTAAHYEPDALQGITLTPRARKVPGSPRTGTRGYDASRGHTRPALPLASTVGRTITAQTNTPPVISRAAVRTCRGPDGALGEPVRFVSMG